MVMVTDPYRKELEDTTYFLPFLGNFKFVGNFSKLIYIDNCSVQLDIGDNLLSSNGQCPIKN